MNHNCHDDFNKASKQYESLRNGAFDNTSSIKEEADAKVEEEKAGLSPELNRS